MKIFIQMKFCEYTKNNGLYETIFREILFYGDNQFLKFQCFFSLKYIKYLTWYHIIIKNEQVANLKQKKKLYIFIIIKLHNFSYNIIHKDFCNVINCTSNFITQIIFIKILIKICLNLSLFINKNNNKIL